MRRPRRVVGLVLLSLLLGVVTTYGVAWGLLNSKSPMPPLIAFSGRALGGWLVSLDELSGVTGVVAYPLHETERGGWLMSKRYRPDETPTWSFVHRMSPNEVDADTGIQSQSVSHVSPIVLERAAGWPRLAVVDREMANTIKPRWIAGQDWSLRTSMTSGFGTTIAFMPVWSGFATDVALFGTAWFAAISGIAWWRRRRRAKAGMCPACRYDLSGLKGVVCPECGSTVKGM